jgi:uncharacterized membrane protein
MVSLLKLCRQQQRPETGYGCGTRVVQRNFVSSPGGEMSDDRQPLSQALKRNIEALRRRRQEEEASAGWQAKVAQAITRFTGSMTFVYLHLLVYGAWIIVNLGMIPGIEPFDPTFVILASEASVEAIFLSTFVLISQNRMAEAADKRSELDLQISLLAEHELSKVAQVVEAIARHLEIEPTELADLGDVKKDIAPEAVLDEIAETTASKRT